jgi:hypothetical protein
VNFALNLPAEEIPVVGVKFAPLLFILKLAVTVPV